MNEKVLIHRLATGVPGLDSILGGGLPEFSFNLITGPPGSGKTTLGHQLMFALASPERPALFFTMLGEPPLKVLRYQQQFAFYDPDRINAGVRYVNLGEEAATGRFDLVLAGIMKAVAASSPALVFIDSFLSIMPEPGGPSAQELDAHQFTQQLGVQLSNWRITSFLIGEWSSDREPHPITSIADGLLLLSQSVYRNAMVRKLQVLKLRGQATSPGIHTFRITGEGIQVFPATVPSGPTNVATAIPGPHHRLAMGIPGLDAMLGGGLPAGYSLLVAGPSGSGKTLLATAFLAEGVRRGEPGIMVAFEQTPSQSWDPTIERLVDSGQLGLINTRLLDLSIDEIVQQLTDLIRQMRATRVVIDSLSGFELAVAPTFREDFRESLFRMVSVLAGLGVTVLMTSELEDRYTDLRFSSYGSAFLTDAIIVQRYIEVRSCLKRVLAVVKVRASAHSDELRQYAISDQGILLGGPMPDYEGLLGGHPTRKPGADERMALAEAVRPE
jgi:circadian clock protein KaiC